MRGATAVLFGLAFALLAPARSSSTTVSADESVLLRVDYTEWASNCLCVHDCRMADSLFVRVRAGDDFLPDRFVYEWPQIKSGGPFRVLGVKGGEVRLRLAGGLHPTSCVRFIPVDTVVTRTPLSLSTCSYDGGMAVSLRVVDSLPSGAVLGVIHERKPHPKPRWPTTILNHPRPRIPADYRGPVRVVEMRLRLAPDASLVEATITRSVSPTLDSLALVAVRTWKFKLGSDCDGSWDPLETQAWVEFEPRGPREAPGGLSPVKP